MTTPDPNLAEQLADVIAKAADEHGTHDHYGQAVETLNWLHAQDRLASPGHVLQLGDRSTRIEQLEAEVEMQHRWADCIAETMPARYDGDEATEELVGRYVADMQELLNLAPGEDVCRAENGGGSDQTEPAIVCLLPATHIDKGHWHQGLGGTWPL
jgi:hypothetical protein